MRFSRGPLLVTWSMVHLALRLEPLTLHQGHGSSAGGDKMCLIFHVISHDRFIERACKYMGGWSLCYITTLISLAHKHCDGGDMMFLICHVTFREHMFKRLCEFMGGSPSWWDTTLLCLVAIGPVKVEI